LKSTVALEVPALSEGAVLEAPAVVAGLDDLAVIGDAFEERLFVPTETSSRSRMAPGPRIA
jgi:hypothetical protein